MSVGHELAQVEQGLGAPEVRSIVKAAGDNDPAARLFGVREALEGLSVPTLPVHVGVAESMVVSGSSGGIIEGEGASIYLMNRGENGVVGAYHWVVLAGDDGCYSALRPVVIDGNKDGGLYGPLSLSIGEGLVAFEQGLASYRDERGVRVFDVGDMHKPLRVVGWRESDGRPAEVYLSHLVMPLSKTAGILREIHASGSAEYMLDRYPVVQVGKVCVPIDRVRAAMVERGLNLFAFLDHPETTQREIDVAVSAMAAALEQFQHDHFLEQLFDHATVFGADIQAAKLMLDCGGGTENGNVVVGVGPIIRGEKFTYGKLFEPLHPWMASSGRDKSHGVAVMPVVRYKWGDHNGDGAYQQYAVDAIVSETGITPLGVPWKMVREVPLCVTDNGQEVPALLNGFGLSNMNMDPEFSQVVDMNRRRRGWFPFW